MIDVFSVILPVFGILVLGYTAARAGWFADGAIDGLSSYVFSFAVPALLFRNMAQTELPWPLPWELWLSYYGGAVAAWALCGIAAAVLFKRSGRDPIAIGYGAAFVNTVMLGIPVVLTGLGEAASTPLFFILAIHALTLFPAATLLFERVSGQGTSFAAVAQSTAIGLIRNPIILGLGGGVLYGASGLPLPGTAKSFLDMLAQSAVPCALFTMGATLTRYEIRGAIGPALTICFFKLLVHPLLVFLVAGPLFGLPEIWVSAAVLLAAVPTGINVFLYAQRYDSAVDAVSSAVVLSTALSFVTLSIALKLLA